MEQVKTPEIIDLSKRPEDYAKPPKGMTKHDHTKAITIWKYVGKIALIVWTVLMLARVPVVGSYPDGLFDYVFGQGKYLFYILAIFVQIGLIFNTGYTRIVKSKKFYIFISIALLSVCCIISGVANMVISFDNPPTFQELISHYHTTWLEYFKCWDYTHYFNINCISGGILAELISYVFNFLSYIVLIVVAAFILVTSVFIIFNINYRSTKIGLRIRSWMIKKLGGTFKFDGYNELKAKRDNQNKIKTAKKADVEGIALTNEVIPFDLLPLSDVNKFDANFKHARLMQNRLIHLFNNKKIDCVPTDINVYSSYSEVCFEAKDKQEVQKILQLQPKIAKATKLDHFNITLRGNIVNIELENAFFSKFSLRTAFEMTKDRKDANAVFGLDRTNKLICQNFKNNASALILGKKGSGAATLAVLMALSTCYVTSPNNLDLMLLNPNCEETYSALVNLPHTNNKVYDSVTSCTDQLHEIQKIVNDRISILRVNNLNNIDQYNMTVGITQPKLKHILVLMPNYDAVLRETFQNGKILSDIIANGKKAGVYIVLQSYKVNNDVIDPELYNIIDQKYILTLESQAESVKIFNNARAYQLHQNGDCIQFTGTRLQGMKRIQVCNLNNAELINDVDIIKTYYTTKLRQKEAKILSEAKNEQTI